MGFRDMGCYNFALRVRVFATPSRHPRDDVAASQPETRGGYRSAAVTPSPHFSPVGFLPQMTSFSDACSTATE
jgi:hypothetical protein